METTNQLTKIEHVDLIERYDFVQNDNSETQKKRYDVILNYKNPES